MASIVSTITINQEFGCRRHRDAGNAGPSATYAAGPFTGGALRYWDKDPGSGSYNGFRPDDAVDLRVRQKVWLFDGTKAHEVAPFEGQRTSIVWYSQRNVWHAGREQTQAPLT